MAMLKTIREDEEYINRSLEQQPRETLEVEEQKSKAKEENAENKHNGGSTKEKSYI